jgi:hypothetical protein
MGLKKCIYSIYFPVSTFKKNPFGCAANHLSTPNVVYSLEVIKQVVV